VVLHILHRARSPVAPRRVRRRSFLPDGRGGRGAGGAARAFKAIAPTDGRCTEHFASDEREGGGAAGERTAGGEGGWRRGARGGGGGRGRSDDSETE
jgi:hypothetical protein